MGVLGIVLVLGAQQWPRWTRSLGPEASVLIRAEVTDAPPATTTARSSRSPVTRTRDGMGRTRSGGQGGPPGGGATPAKARNRASGGQAGKPPRQRKQPVPRSRGEDESEERPGGQVACSSAVDGARLGDKAMWGAQAPGRSRQTASQVPLCSGIPIPTSLQPNGTPRAMTRARAASPGLPASPSL